MTANTESNDFAIEEVVQQLNACATMPSDLIEIFSEEAEEHLQKIYQGMGRLKENPGDQDALGEVRRVSHTLKGAAGAVGHQAMTRLAHRMEDLLDQLAETGSGVSDCQLELLFNTSDQLQLLSSGNFDLDQVAQQIVELYRGFDEQVGARTFESAGEAAEHSHPPSSQDNQSDQPSVAEGQSSAKYLRVPLKRLDDMSKQFGEMTVNLSELEHRMLQFGSRIADMQNAMRRIRKIKELVEESGDYHDSHRTTGTNLADSSPFTKLRRRSSSKFSDEFDPLEFEQYSDSYLLEQQLTESDNDAEMMAGEFNKIKAALDGLLQRQHRLNRNAQECLMKVRLVPFGSIASRLERTVRTVSRKLSRQVEFEFIGKEIEVDKTVLDEIADPALHLIRNALDHGIEDTDVRIESGKRETACLRFQATHHGTQVTLKISDDGAGLNLKKIRQKAIDQGMIEADASLSNEELHSMIFRPGFSTAKSLSDVSGRGIGMDVVSDAVRRLKGSIRVDSEAGVGTTFTIQIPTGVGVTRALFLEAGGQQFAIPIQSVQKIDRIQPTNVETNGRELIANHSDGDLRLIDLASHLGLRSNSFADAVSEKSSPMLIHGDGNDAVGIAVDVILSCRDISIKGIGNHLQAMHGLAGVTITGNGSVVPILDVADIVSGNSDNMLPSPLDTGQRVSPPRKKLAMVIDDSLSVRRVNENLLKFAGWQVVTATDGVDALARLPELETGPDVFLCDMEMPRMDGLEFIRQVREQAEFQSTPIVMVTSRASEKHRHRAFEAGATEYVVKPYNGEALLDMLSDLVSVSHATVG